MRNQYTKQTFKLLKDFQKDTVRFAYKKLEQNHKFLVADEVGLGKTMIAKGVIAKTIDKLSKENKEKINIIYITTNQSIAHQNIQTLKLGESNLNSTRLSLLITTFNEEKYDKDQNTSPIINFRSFTVGTSLEFKNNSTGKSEEREFIVYLLRHKKFGLLKGLASTTIWKFFKQNSDREMTVEEFKKNYNRFYTNRYFQVPDAFIENYSQSVANDNFIIKEIGNIRNLNDNMKQSSKVIKRLRKLLVLENLKYLNADLIILDEFQRFSKLLTDEEYEDKDIIEALFENSENTKTLLLSATPYKLLDCKNNDHYNEFYDLIKWLINSKTDKKINKLKKLFEQLSRGEDTTSKIERILKQVMCRTERVSFSDDSMIKKLNIDDMLKVTLEYLDEYKKYYNLKMQGSTRYIKSASNALNYMKPYLKSKTSKDGYRLKKQFLDMGLYKEFTITGVSHPKQDALDSIVDSMSLKNLIWMPPVSPHIEEDNKLTITPTKILIFSKWDFVPDSIVGSFSTVRKDGYYNATDNYDGKHFVDRNQLLGINVKTLNPYLYKGIRTKEALLRDIKLESINAKLLLGSPANCIYRSIKKYTNIDDNKIQQVVSIDTPDENKKSLANMFIKFLGREENYNQIKNYNQSKKNKHKSTKKLEMILDYCIDHNIQAMFDEYIYLLCDSPKFQNKDEDEKLEEIHKVFSTIFSLRPNEVTFDNFIEDGKNIIKSTKVAMRISKSSMVQKIIVKNIIDNKIEEDEKPLTSDNVKEAFNSPFAPFILATTSIGQEGLDFHPYCHQIWHWEIPSNPVDLEQREGRIHRYKNYAVRKNVAFEFQTHCWKEMFENARNMSDGDFETYWLFTSKDNHQKIERVIPVLPFTKEAQRYEQLEKQLGVYRTAIGQKRQKEHMENNNITKQISLKPPRT